MLASNLNDLQAFAAVARLRSFRKAAVEIDVTPSALSHAMRGLESRLGIRLLNRTTRSVSLTDAGELLFEKLTPALHDLNHALDAVNRFREQPTGSMRINAPKAAIDHVLGPLVVRFLREHPGMRVELVSEDALVDIVADGFDAGVRFGESLHKDMVAVPIGSAQRFIVVAAPEYLKRKGKPKIPHDLQTHDCIRIRFPSGVYYRWEFAKDGQNLEVEVDGALASSDMQQMVAAAEAGLGLAYVYEQYARDALSQGTLKMVLADWCPSIPGFYLYYPSRKLLPVALRVFVDMLRGA